MNKLGQFIIKDNLDLDESRRNDSIDEHVHNAVSSSDKEAKELNEAFHRAAPLKIGGTHHQFDELSHGEVREKYTPAPPNPFDELGKKPIDPRLIQTKLAIAKMHPKDFGLPPEFKNISTENTELRYELLMLFDKHTKEFDVPNSVKVGFILECFESFRKQTDNLKLKQTVKNWAFVDKETDIEPRYVFKDTYTKNLAGKVNWFPCTRKKERRKIWNSLDHADHGEYVSGRRKKERRIFCAERKQVHGKENSR